MHLSWKKCMTCFPHVIANNRTSSICSIVGFRHNTWYNITQDMVLDMQRWHLRMRKPFYLTLCNRCSYVSILGIKLNHVSEHALRCISLRQCFLLMMYTRPSPPYINDLIHSTPQCLHGFPLLCLIVTRYRPIYTCYSGIASWLCIVPVRVMQPWKM